MRRCRSQSANGSSACAVRRGVRRRSYISTFGFRTRCREDPGWLLVVISGTSSAAGEVVRWGCSAMASASAAEMAGGFGGMQEGPSRVGAAGSVRTDSPPSRIRRPEPQLAEIGDGFSTGVTIGSSHGHAPQRLSKPSRFGRSFPSGGACRGLQMLRLPTTEAGSSRGVSGSRDRRYRAVDCSPPQQARRLRTFVHTIGRCLPRSRSRILVCQRRA